MSWWKPLLGVIVEAVAKWGVGRLGEKPPPPPVDPKA